MFHIFILILILFGIHLYIHHSRTSRLINVLPGPRVWPIIGNAIDFLNGSSYIFYKFRSMAKEYKTNYRFWVVHVPIVNLIEPDDIGLLLSNHKHIAKNFLYNVLKQWMVGPLLLSKGTKWQFRRKMITKAFHFGVLKRFCPMFAEHGKYLVNELKSEIGKSETDIQLSVGSTALNIVSEAAMNTNITSLNNNVVSYIEAIHKYGRTITYRVARIWLYIDLIFSFTDVGKKHDAAVRDLREFTSLIIDKRRKSRIINGNLSDLNKSYEDDDTYPSEKKRLGVLDILLTAEDHGMINAEGVQEEIDGIVFAGYDTITMSVTMTCLMLANNPDIQERAFQEVYDVLGDSDRDMTIDELNNMNYLERCFKETLRLYPSVPFIGRYLEEDLKLTNYTLPAGTVCNVHIYDLHRDPRIYPDPEKYDPDRFLPEISRDRHPYAYIPFSAGPKNCIGKKFAQLEVMAILSRILQNYRLEPVTLPEELIFEVDIVLRPLNSIKMKILPRNNIN